MLDLANYTLLFSLLLIFIKFLPELVKDNDERIVGFYLIFSIFVTLIIINNMAEFKSIFDIVLLLFLVKLTALMLILRRKNK